MVNESRMTASFSIGLLAEGKNVNKSEIARAGLQALAKLPEGDLVDAFEGVVKVRPGRPTRS